MYAAKRNRVRSRRYEPCLELDTSRLALTGQLHAAFDEGHTEMFFQPQVDAASGRLTNVEALVRSNHPELGLLLPDSFIELVSVAGFTNELLEVAVRQSIAALRCLPDDVGVAINLTAHDVRSPSLAERCAALLAEARIEPSRVTFEITETHILDTSGTVAAVLEHLHELGVKLAIDDFGTGYSSFSYLKRFQIHKLKIDQSFVRDLNTDGNSASIAQAIISMAHSLDLTVIAEGVETPEQAQWLAAHHCDEAQGYLYARPMPVDQFETRLGQFKAH